MNISNSSTDSDFGHLALLLKASSKKQVLELFKDTHQYILNSTEKESLIKKTVTEFGIGNIPATELIKAVSSLIRVAKFHNCSTPEEITSIFPNDFHSNLKDLLTKILIECMPDWRVQTLNNSVSIPKLKTFSWRVDAKMTTDDAKRSNAPSCILQLEIEENKEHKKDERSTRYMNVELSKETLDTMLHGLGRIRDQLSAVAKK